ncbi:RNA recognition motif domain and Zinc finger, RanBP2-type domain and Nucleotide-binding, alpha-beta plait domain-containing protein [Strongyloides ratti]|uniref:RNA recognition motif domain and Zinc finger, RanBP2-type domain and Nucleotide-binding, alpha-beta plait domain-containing protein n=1 Tax=Strongyloides ratti TaxID=34506 RepID=A0A090LAI6_STRRB|nr:RNA recognition motif domain and Zinc finger, RanBP2-type domain and Nucleotide-binding, alpha-beta plait domain-containing protein [Strongyloides ratti]CEF66742.1 RNA recognition motif domain and Zinc finger, RanBP2-type domain and Nucleotide-binding, alpha-beta plait domain-containing protein [Strongyloides ratti]
MDSEIKKKKSKGKKRTFPYDNGSKHEPKKYFTNNYQQPFNDVFCRNDQYLSYNNVNNYTSGVQYYGNFYNNMYNEMLPDPRSGYYCNILNSPQINNGYPYLNYNQYYNNRINYTYNSTSYIQPPLNVCTNILSKDSLYITNIPFECTKFDIFGIFNFNNLIARNTINGEPRIKLYKDQQTRASCLITFLSPEAAAYVKKTMDKKEYPGSFKKMKIKYAKYKNRTSDNFINPHNDHNKNSITSNSKNIISSIQLPSKNKTLPNNDKKMKEDEKIVGGYIARFETKSDEENKEENYDKNDNEVTIIAEVTRFTQDWKCETCETLNYYYRDKCYHCNESKCENK